MIPKILHQIWIGPLPAPSTHMKTWQDKHPDFEYIYWTETEFEKRGIQFQCQSKIDIMTEYNGKADIMRWEILYKYGGYFVDADSICIEPFDDYFTEQTAFASFENEIVRAELIATGTMGFVPNHPLCKDIIQWIDSPEFDELNKTVRAWGSVGPVLLTRFLKTGKYTDFAIYPSLCFLPFHFTGNYYTGHKKVYAYQLWGTANNSYETMNSIELPSALREPTLWVSVLIPSYNTSQLHIRECLESIKCQNGFFGIELVWVNDGSGEEYTNILEKELTLFLKRTRFCKIVYLDQALQQGVAHSLNIGLKMCSNEIVFRMDSDDIMLPNRMQCQIDFMQQNPECVLCGTNVQMFSNENPTNPKMRTMGQTTSHSSKISWNDFAESLSKPSWIMNHPTLCFYKSAIASVGYYNINVKPMEDYELELKIMKKYGAVYNIPSSLLYYRIHPNQVTYDFNNKFTDINKLHAEIIEDVTTSTFPFVLDLDLGVQ
jgi:hypothetical protein